uniref:Peptidase S1 domain-containing protein n=1 Tax=Ditylenchus dipsaci TaxID=166011 RepID=A0A915D1T3_9BILA
MFAPIYFLLIVWLQITYASKYKMRRVDPGYNSKLQLFCANPQFLNHSSTAQKKIMHGTPVPKGKYPWAIVMKAVISGQTASYCGGTIISSRHILTARHCFEKHPESLTFFVGGVCYEKGENCDEVDMRPVEIEFAAFEPRDPLEANNRTIKLRNHEHDFALVQLKEDLKHFGGDKMFRDTRPACLPQLKEPLARKCMCMVGGPLKNKCLDLAA